MFLESIVWIDGAVTARDTIDPGLTHGVGVFETVLVLHGIPFGIEEHLQRMEFGAGVLGLAPPREVAVEAVATVLGQAPVMACAKLRLNWTPGGDSKGFLVVHLEEYVAPESVRAVSTNHRRNDQSPLVGVKATSYAENLLALVQAQNQGADEAIMANTRGDVAEGATSNIFFEHDGELFTPPISSGCLPGVTRAWCMRWAKEEGLEIAERVVPMRDLHRIPHMAITSALKGVCTVSHYDDQKLEPGTLLTELHDIFIRRRHLEVFGTSLTQN